MRHLASFVELTRRLTQGRSPAAAEGRLPDDDRHLDRLAVHLLELGRELRAELPDPWGFVHRIAEATLEVASLVAPWDSPEVAVKRLAGLQIERFEQCAGLAPTDWRTRLAHAHLASAYWQLAGLSQEVSFGSSTAGPGDGQLEEHAADLANYLLFAALTSGAWDLTLGDGLLPPELARLVRQGFSTSGPDFPASEFPGVGSKKGGRR